MRDFASYFAAGAVAMLAIFVIAQPGDANTSLESAIQSPLKSSIQAVDRSNKGDRLSPPTAVKPASPQERPRMMAGCDPAFSPLSASAYANFAARCVA